MKKWKIIVTAILMVLGVPLITGCRDTFGNHSRNEASGEQLIEILNPDDLTVVNQITGESDIMDYVEMTFDESSMQEVLSLPENAEKLYVIRIYETKRDLSRLGNSGEVWLNSIQETLYRADDTYYLETGMILDEKDGIYLNGHFYFQLPDSVGDYYMSLAEGENEVIDEEELFASWGIENYDKKFDEYDEEFDEFDEEVDTFVDDLDKEWDEFDEEWEEYAEEADIFFDEFDEEWKEYERDIVERQSDVFLTKTESILELGIEILIRLIMGALFIPLCILYILGSIGLYRMAKKMGYQSPWLAWVPIANLYLMYILPGGSFRVLILNKVIEKRENAFWIVIAGTVIRRMIREVFLFPFPDGRFFSLFDDGVSIAWLVFLIFFLYPCYRDLFRLFETEQKAKTFAVLSFIIPILLPIFLLVAASKEPKKTEEHTIIETPESSGYGTLA